MKKALLLLMLLAIPLANAGPSSVNVLNLDYDKGDISLIEKYNTIGYFPDRKIQPEKGYLLEILSDEGNVIYSFRFSPPTDERLDGFFEGKNIGGVQVRDRFNFSLIVPSFPNEEEIKIWEGERESGRFSIKAKTLTGTVIISILIKIILILGMAAIIRHKIKSSRKERSYTP